MASKSLQYAWSTLKHTPVQQTFNPFYFQKHCIYFTVDNLAYFFIPYRLRFLLNSQLLEYLAGEH
jgi:hypothetical protein